jgi:hypothetical protein
MAEDLKNRAQEKLAQTLFELGVYRHHKGGLYTAFATSIDEATLQPLVHYYSHVKHTRWTRTLENFTEQVELPDERGKLPRFEYMGPASTVELTTACFDGAE